MGKYLITGFSGFVSRHFLDYLESNKINSEVLGVDLLTPHFQTDSYSHVQCSFEKVDLLDKNQVDNLIYQFQPTYILHLASFSSVAFSWKDPIKSFKNNTNIFLNLLEKVRGLDLDCRILSIGSSEGYGNVTFEELPLKENHDLKPVSPYAVARVSQELLSRVYVDGYNMDIVITRSFNHIGTYQREIFAVSSFIKQFVQAKKNGKNEVELMTGDTSVVRDFLDVRDVVSAYYMLFDRGKKGEIYNVCSGHGVSLKDVIDLIALKLDMGVSVSVNERYLRPQDNRAMIGSNEKIKLEIGWSSTIPLEKSIEDMVAYWNSVL